MRIFFSLGQTKLPPSMLCHPFTQRVGDLTRGENRRHKSVMRLGIFHHTEKGRPYRPNTCIEVVKSRITHGTQDFARAVSPEIQTKEAVTILCTGIIPDHGRSDEFIAFGTVIARCYGCMGIGRPHAFGVDHRLKSLGYAFPAIVAVHCEITPCQRADPSARRKHVLQLLKVAIGRARGDVAPVCHQVQHDSDTCLGDRPRGCQHMAYMPVHATVRQ